MFLDQQSFLTQQLYQIQFISLTLFTQSHTTLVFPCPTTIDYTTTRQYILHFFLGLRSWGSDGGGGGGGGGWDSTSHLSISLRLKIAGRVGMLSRLSKHLSHAASRNLLFQRRLSPNEGTSLWSSTFATQAGTSTARQHFVADGNMTDKVFASYSVYKGKAALSASPKLPTFSKLDSGGVKVDRKGSIMLTFWPAVGERRYDWEKKQHFALSATEIGSMINLGPQDSCEFFHDPAMLSSNAGQVRKSLSIKPHADGSGYFFSLNVVNNILKTNERLVVPVTAAEFAVMRTAFSPGLQFALPRIMGWDQYSNQPSGTTHKNPSKVLPQLLDSEWNK